MILSRKKCMLDGPHRIMEIVLVSTSGDKREREETSLFREQINR